MHSLDEPLDLKLSISKLRAAREKRDRTLGSAKPQALRTTEDGTPPARPGSSPECKRLVLGGLGAAGREGGRVTRLPPSNL